MSQDFSLQQLSRASTKDLVLCSQAAARDLLSFEDAYKLNILPICLVENAGQKILVTAYSGKNPVEAVQALRFATGYESKVVSIEDCLLKPAIFEAYHRDGSKFVSVVEELQEASPAVAANSHHQEVSLAVGDAGRLLVALLDLAVAQQASDIQLSPRRDGLYMAIRVQGERKVMQKPLCSLDLAKKLTNKIRVLCKLDTTHSHVPQDASFEIALPHGARPVRVSLLPTLHGTQVALRLFGSVQQRNISSLFTEEQAAAIAMRALQAPSGLIILAGSTGSGKTTTLYSFMQHLVARNLNVISLEDPVEAEIVGVSQTSINVDRGLSYAAALKSALRQDPDAILIGEIRDAEVANIACEAALTGHLVLATLHAGNVREVFLRLEQLVRSEQRASKALSLIFCQKLIPELCDKCRVIDLDSSKRFSVKAAKAVGCHHCDYAGFASRICVVEGLYAKNLGLDDLCQAKVDELEAQGLFISPKKQLMRLFASGRISADAVSTEYFDSVWDVR